MDGDDVRPGVLGVVSLRLGVNVMRLQQELKVGEQGIAAGVFRLRLDDFPALRIVGVRVPILLPWVGVAIADSVCERRQLVGDQRCQIGRTCRWTPSAFRISGREGGV